MWREKLNGEKSLRRIGRGTQTLVNGELFDQAILDRVKSPRVISTGVAEQQKHNGKDTPNKKWSNLNNTTIRKATWHPH